MLKSTFVKSLRNSNKFKNIMNLSVFNFTKEENKDFQGSVIKDKGKGNETDYINKEESNKIPK